MKGVAAALRLAAAAACVLWAASAWGRLLVEALLPPIGALLSAVASDFRILGVALVREGPDTSLEARAMLAHTLVLAGRAVVPDGHSGFAVTTTLGTVLQPLAAAAIVVLGWPGRWLESALRVPLAVTLALPLVALDAPLYLAGSLWDMQLSRHDPQGFSPLVWWMHLLAGGGRIALGCAAGALAVLLAARLTRRGAPAGADDPARP